MPAPAPRTYLDNIDFLRASFAGFPYAAHYGRWNDEAYSANLYFPKCSRPQQRGWVQTSISPNTMLVLYDTIYQRDSECSAGNITPGFPPGFSFGDPLATPAMAIAEFNTDASKKRCILDITREMVAGR